jgi:hypothetical protein
MAFDIKKYKSKFASMDAYFAHSRALKEYNKEITLLDKCAADNVSCSICYEVIDDNQYIDSFICKHFFHNGCKYFIDVYKNSFIKLKKNLYSIALQQISM